MPLLLPLMVPALATAAVFTFIWTRNDFFSQLLYETRLQNYTAAVALNSYLDQQGSSDFGGMFAMSVVCLAPLFFVSCSVSGTWSGESRRRESARNDRPRETF